MEKNIERKTGILYQFIGLTLTILHDPKYLIPWELWRYGTLR